MEPPGSLRSDDEERVLLKSYLSGMDIEVVREVEEDGNWGIWTLVR